ncbi:TolB-like translocation protein [Stenotrophomonas maltophilia]|uniref:PD40 domain-containing protein n=1 Tax=Stenotrophomonas maltophilia TaxID=40324 RepID=UPI0018D27CA2|nr:PD40 domain-containing protein [Stenotrophomonas maltophilia]HDS1300934.1 PD40 domain-containing protein [Stenotrophomonas maltophilia]HDS1522977.1 PD40 domain-containing protein [Stenotrophomonas maltophilia]HDS1657578.1 PD40 domain-containing protein [Stenotrophomonas maltophilia]HDS1671600.1 PD40 domain-containing protein [Stenotrophomonas maltophilia]
MKTLLAVVLLVAASPPASPSRGLQIVGPAERFAPGVASTQYDEIRLTLSPDGKTALWFSRNRPGGPGGYDIWVSRHDGQRWRLATPVPFNTPGRDFDPAFSADGRVVYFCSDRAGGQGGDDLYRVSMGSDGRFGEPINLGPAVNSAADEFAPMLSPDAGTLLFSSDRAGGAGGHDLYIATMVRGVAERARPLAGDLNTVAQEFDATFLGDGRTLVFARALDFGRAPVRQFIAYERGGRYDTGHALPSPLNEVSGDSYGAMLDGSQPGTLTYSARRADGAGLDLYRIRYRMTRP